MKFTNRIFNYVKEKDPKTWNQILRVTRLYKLSSVKKVFDKLLKYNVNDLEIFNDNLERVPVFLLKFCEALLRKCPSPGDSYGTLLTCRTTHIYTQDTLDKRHLKSQNFNSVHSNYIINNDLNFELNIYTSLNQIFEITNRRKFTTIFVKDYSVQDLLKLNSLETCHLTSTLSNACLKTYIITESFIPGYLKIIQKSEHKHFIFRHINPRNIVAFTDLKYINEKCGLICYYFNLINILKLQFFKKMKIDGEHEKDIINVLKYQYYTGKLLPINRNGLKKNENRSGLDKCAFEAMRQNLTNEAILEKTYLVDSPISQIIVGKQFSVGTGDMNFALKSK